MSECPVLDWASGSARAVREAVLSEFETIRNATGQQIVLRLRHDVSAVTPVGTGYRIDFERDAIGRRERAQTEVDIIVFAFGFGREPIRPIQHTPTESYWTDGGFPGPAIDGKALPVFFVSGNGDGGLIDFVAAASAAFDHDAMIRTIAHRKGVVALAPELLAIDAEARLAEIAGNGYDFVAAYDARINAQISALGLINEVAERLRPGVQLVLQTRGPDLMSIQTATLNRLAVYLVIKACALDPTKSFRHIVCATVIPIERPVAANAPPRHRDGNRTVESRGTHSATLSRQDPRKGQRPRKPNGLLDHYARSPFADRARVGESTEADRTAEADNCDGSRGRRRRRR